MKKINLLPEDSKKSRSSSGLIRRNRVIRAPGFARIRPRLICKSGTAFPQRASRICLSLCALFFICAMTLPLVLSCAEQSPEQFTKLGDKAPAFSLSDVDGEMISLADYRGKIVILDFGATWCKPCKEAAPVLEGIYRKYGDRGVVVIGINMETGDYAREAVKSFITENEITYPMLMDDGQVSRRYFIVRIPTTYILDRNLNAAGEIAGFPPGYEERLVAEIEKLLSAKNE